MVKVKFADGKVEDLGKPKRKRVLEPGVAYEVTKILKQNVQSGTGTKANYGCPAAGKTGTTDSYNDAWFDGYTPNLATAVWVGYPDALREMRSVHGIEVAGGTFPAEIWNKFMQVAKDGKCNDFTAPDQSAEFTPFFGKYCEAGRRLEGLEPELQLQLREEPNQEEDPAPTAAAATAVAAVTAAANGGGGRRQRRWPGRWRR